MEETQATLMYQHKKENQFSLVCQGLEVNLIILMYQHNKAKSEDVRTKNLSEYNQITSINTGLLNESNYIIKKQGG